MRCYMGRMKFCYWLPALQRQALPTQPPIPYQHLWVLKLNSGAEIPGTVTSVRSLPATPTPCTVIFLKS